jgi:uncharacterized protein (TIGR02117 family)
MRKAWRWALAVAAGLLGSVVLYLAAALLLSRLPLNADFHPAPEGVLIGVIDNGVHADLLLPIQAAGVDWRDRFRLAAFPRLGWAPSELRFVSVGWGQREFYLATPSWAELRPAVAARALLGLGGTVLHVAYWPALKDSSRIVWTVIPVEAYRRLAAYVAGSLALDGEGRTQLVNGAGYGQNDAFFAATGRYGPILTCNEWLSRGLAAAGVRTGLWTPFPGAILEHLRAVPAG